MNGWMGKVLRVDLTRGEMREERIPDHIYADYLGGTGLAAELRVVQNDRGFPGNKASGCDIG